MKEMQRPNPTVEWDARKRRARPSPARWASRKGERTLTTQTDHSTEVVFAVTTGRQIVLALAPLASIPR
jgi:hypothetical protein